MPGEQHLINMNIERLNKPQKCATCIILKADLMTPSADMFQSLGWIPVNSRLKYNKAIFTYKALNDQTPAYISNISAETCNITFRSSEIRYLTVLRSRTLLCDRSFSCLAPKLWKSLLDSARMEPFLNIFKMTAKHHLNS